MSKSDRNPADALRAVAGAIAALAVGTAGGAVFFALGSPLPWALGALAASAIAAVCGGPWRLPGPVRDVARPAIGVVAGSAFTPAVVASIADWWPAVAFVVVYTLAMTAIGWRYFRRVCGLDPVTGFFAAAPGGLSEMVLQGGALGGHVRTLALIHSTRIVAVVFTVPFAVQLALGAEMGRGAAPLVHAGEGGAIDWLVLAACGLVGFGLARIVDLPGGAMVLAMVLSAAAHGFGVTELTPPGWLLAIIQVVIGSIAGARFAGVSWREARRTVLHGLGWAAVLLLTAGCAALAAARLLDRSAAALLLALAPGGLPEMTVVAYALGFEIAFVVTCQVVRSFASSACAPILYRLYGSPGARRPDD